MIPADPAPTISSPADAPAQAGVRARIEARMAMLTRLAQIGMELAEACGREAQAEAPDPNHNPGLTFARVARAVRMTIALQSRLEKDLADIDRADDNAAASRKDRRRMRLSCLVHDAVRDQVEAAIDAGRRFSGEDAIETEIEQRACDAFERLTDAEDHEDYLGRPFGAVVAAICADLGLSPDWTARLTAATAPPPAPLRPAEGGGGPSVALAKEGGGACPSLHADPPHHPAYGAIPLSTAWGAEAARAPP